MNMNGLTNYDTAVFANLPVTVVIYEPVYGENGQFLDYRIVYGNPKFANDFRRIYGHDRFLDAFAIRDHLVDDVSIQMMHQYRNGKPQAFSTYISFVDIHVHMEPLTDLPEGYIGYLITNLADFSEEDSRAHFLRVVSQMNNNAVLYKRNDDGTLTTVNVTPSFCEMMECATREDALRLMDGDGLLESTFEEDRKAVLDMLARRVGPDGTRDLTIRKVTTGGKMIWCNVHYAFIDDYEEHYIYSTYSNVTDLKNYEAQLQSIYTSMGNNFYQVDENTLVRIRVNLTKDLVEETGGTAGFPFNSDNMSFSDVLRIRVGYFPIEHEKTEFMTTFCASALTNAYMDGHVTVSRVLYTRLPDNTVSYVKLTANVTRHPMTSDIVAFISEESNNPEKLASTIEGKILAKQFEVEHVLGADDLVEEVPSALEGKCALSLAPEQVPPGVVEVAIAHVLHLAPGAQEFCHRGVVRVVVHVAHHDDVLRGVGLSDAVGQGAHLLAGIFAIDVLMAAARPVAHHDGEVVARQRALHAQVGTSLPAGVAVLIDVGLVEGILYVEGLGVVDEGAVHASLVGPLEMNVLIPALLHVRLSHEVVEHLVVLHLHRADDAGAVGQLVCAEVAQHFRHVCKLVLILVVVPVIGAAGQEVIVNFAGVVGRVEQVLQIVESDGMNHQLAVLRFCGCGDEKQRCHQGDE